MVYAITSESPWHLPSAQYLWLSPLPSQSSMAGEYVSFCSTKLLNSQPLVSEPTKWRWRLATLSYASPEPVIEGPWDILEQEN